MIVEEKSISILQDHNIKTLPFIYKMLYLTKCQLHNEINSLNSRVRTLQFQNSFLPKTVADWNNLDNDTKISTSFESHTNKLNTFKS